MVNNDNFDYYKQANEVLGKARKISRSQLKAFTIKLLKEQGGVCAVCKQPISLRTAGAKSDYCVDHCHVTGLVRGVRLLGASAEADPLLRFSLLIISRRSHRRRSTSRVKRSICASMFCSSSAGVIAVPSS